LSAIRVAALSFRRPASIVAPCVAERRKQTVAELALADLTASDGSAFLRYTEQERGDTIGTHNCRLAALRSFFGFVAGREPATIAQCAEILRIPTKKAPIYAPCYLEPEEAKAILAQPDRSTIEGCDHALLSFLYNTGARIQESLDVCLRAIRFDSPAFVRLYGKGRKERVCPLWPETVSLLKSLLRRRPRADDEPIFVNRSGVPLGPSGVRFKPAEYFKAGAKVVPSLRSKHVTPHSFRHATAAHLVAAGVDITVIRSWLGHVSLDTTNHYAQANLETKRKALERLEDSSRPNKPPAWKHDKSVIAWLDTL
jgi:site-specific recombinase XerD